jgi:antitoxin PrlF
VLEANLTSKGQITIPAHIRRALGLTTRDRVTFTLMPDGTVVLRAKTKSIRELRGMLKPAPGTTVSTEKLSMGSA